MLGRVTVGRAGEIARDHSTISLSLVSMCCVGVRRRKRQMCDNNPTV